MPSKKRKLGLVALALAMTLSPLESLQAAPLPLEESSAYSAPTKETGPKRDQESPAKESREKTESESESSTSQGEERSAEEESVAPADPASAESTDVQEEKPMEAPPEEEGVLATEKKALVRYQREGDLFLEGDQVVTNRWVDLAGDRYFADGEGHPYRNCFIHFGDRYYLLNGAGELLTGFAEYDGNYYYLSEKPETLGLRIQANAWVETDQGWIFPNSQGVLYRDQFISFGAANRYYMLASGLRASGKTAAQGTVYNLDANGKLIQKSQRYSYDGKEYFSDPTGLPYRSHFLTFGPGRTQIVGADGAVQTGLTPFQGTVYRLDDQGWLIPKSSAYDYDGKHYFARPDGHPYRNQMLSFGSKAYYMGADGSRQYGLIKGTKKTYYADPETGLLQKNMGLFSIGGKTYYSGDAFAMAQGWVRLDGVQYYFDPSGDSARLENTRRILGGVSYSFDGNGHATRLVTYSEPGEWYYDGYTLYGPAVPSREVGPNHTIISLDHQYMWIFVDGDLALSTAVITGRPSMPTVTGSFVVQGKERNRTLKGPTWESQVSYWVPFYYAYGIHDAWWQSGGDFYKNSGANRWTGSHGCVNVRPSVMRRAYPLFRVGSAVTVY